MLTYKFNTIRYIAKVTMVYKCAAVNCRSGYRGEKQDQKVTFHSFALEDKHLLQTWLKRLARKDYVPTKNSKLCFLHFKFEDYVTDSTDQKEWRKRKRETATLIRKLLRKDACPSIFKDLLSCYTYNNYLVRSGLSTSSRFENEAARLKEQSEVFLNADKVESFKDLIEKLPEELHRQRYILHRTKNGADLFFLSDHRPYTILSAVFINMVMEVTVYNNEQIVPSSSYNHIMPTSKVTMVSQVSNLLAFVKNLDLKNQRPKSSLKQIF